MPNKILRREWIERIRQHLAKTTAMCVSLLGDWHGISDADKEDSLLVIQAEIKTIITMMQGRFVFKEKTKTDNDS